MGRTYLDPKTVISKKSRFVAALALDDRSGYLSSSCEQDKQCKRSTRM